MNIASRKKNIVFERYKFWSRKQCDGESAKEWITALKGKASSCEFGEQKDQLIRDKIVFDINDKGLKERMLRESQLSLEDAIAICNTVEASRFQLKEMENSEHYKEIYALKDVNNPDSKRRTITVDISSLNAVSVAMIMLFGSARLMVKLVVNAVS